MLILEQDSRGVILPVRAHASARQNAILGVRAGALRVAVTAAPEKGKANRAIVALLARTIGVPKSSVELIHGDISPQKRFLIIGAEIARVRSALSATIRE